MPEFAKNEERRWAGGGLCGREEPEEGKRKGSCCVVERKGMCERENRKLKE